LSSPWKESTEGLQLGDSLPESYWVEWSRKKPANEGCVYWDLFIRPRFGGDMSDQIPLWEEFSSQWSGSKVVEIPRANNWVLVSAGCGAVDATFSRRD
jgi:hypothetical protein